MTEVEKELVQKLIECGLGDIAAAYVAAAAKIRPKKGRLNKSGYRFEVRSHWKEEHEGYHD